MSVHFPWFGFVISVSQQGLITTDKIYVGKRESFKKAKVRAQWHLQTVLISALQQFMVEGRGKIFFTTCLSSLWSLPACFFLETDHKTFYLDVYASFSDVGES